MNELQDSVSQHANALTDVNEKLKAAQRDNQQLKFQLDDALRRAADERQRSDSCVIIVVVVVVVVRHTTFVVIMCKHCSVCYCQFSQYKQPGVLLLLSGTTFDNICCHYV